MRLALQHLSLAVLGMLVLVSTAPAADRAVEVSGTGEVLAPPDEVAFGLSMKAVDDDLNRVRATNDKQLSAVMDLAKKHGLKQDTLKVGRMGLSLTYDSQLKRTIYHVDRTVEVRLGELGNVNPLILDLLRQPDLTINEIVFRTTKMKEFEKEARAKAMADAREKAQQLAEYSQLKLGKAKRINSVTESHRDFAASIAPLANPAAPAQADPFGAAPAAPAPNAIPVRLEPEAKFVPVATFTVKDGEGKPQGASPPGFGLGNVRFSVTVSVEFELTE